MIEGIVPTHLRLVREVSRPPLKILIKRNLRHQKRPNPVSTVFGAVLLNNEIFKQDLFLSNKHSNISCNCSPWLTRI